jgi:MFS family permease
MRMTIDSLRTLRNRNFRLFFAGQSLSLLGTWMQKAAVSWVVYSLTHSKLMLGVSVFATLFPSALLSLLGGVVSDRYRSSRVLLLTQVLSLGQAVLLTLAVYLGEQQHVVWEIIGLSAVLGVINAFEWPSRQSLVYELVATKDDLPNAVALNSTMSNLTKLLGPALAGYALERLGAVACFGLNAVSFGPVIASLLLLRLPPPVAKARGVSIGADLREGLQYVRHTPALRFIMYSTTLSSLLVMPFTNLMPAYAQDIFHGTATTFGLLDGAIGLGGFIGALFLTARSSQASLSQVLTVNSFVLGVGLLLFAYTPWYALALLFLTIAAFGLMIQITVNVTLLQLAVRPAMRGRVISLFVLLNTSALPLGGLLVGWIAQRSGLQPVVLAEGGLALLIGWLYLRESRQLQAAATSPA